MSAVRPHKATSPCQPDTCPVCGNPYKWRVPRQLDNYPVGGHYRHRHRRHAYIHQIDPEQVNKYRWPAPGTGGDTA